MRHVIVTRVTALLAALFLVAASLFVRIVTDTAEGGPPPIADASLDGAALFEAKCASCHAADDLRASVEDLSDARRLELERFLADHGDTSAEDDRLILEYLSGKFPRSRD